MTDFPVALHSGPSTQNMTDGKLVTSIIIGYEQPKDVVCVKALPSTDSESPYLLPRVGQTPVSHGWLGSWVKNLPVCLY
jgi:hypothetical protein